MILSKKYIVNRLLCYQCDRYRNPAVSPAWQPMCREIVHEPNATLAPNVALCQWLRVAGMRCIGNRLHNPRKRRLMGRKLLDVCD